MNDWKSLCVIVKCTCSSLEFGAKKGKPRTIVSPLMNALSIQLLASKSHIELKFENIDI